MSEITTKHMSATPVSIPEWRCWRCGNWMYREHTIARCLDDDLIGTIVVCDACAVLLGHGDKVTP